MGSTDHRSRHAWLRMSGHSDTPARCPPQKCTSCGQHRGQWTRMTPSRPHLSTHSHTSQHTATPVNNTQPHCQHTATQVNTHPDRSTHSHTQHTATPVNTQPHRSTHSHNGQHTATPVNTQPRRSTHSHTCRQAATHVDHTATHVNRKLHL